MQRLARCRRRELDRQDFLGKELTDCARAMERNRGSGLVNRKEAQRPIGLCPRPADRVTAMRVAAACIGKAKLRRSAMGVE